MSSSGPDWMALEAAISGRVVLPGTGDYDWVRKPFIARFDDLEPQAIVRCATPEDVAEVIRFARRYVIDTATRSGGHSIAGYSSTRGIVIDVGPMRSVVVGDGVARVGAGTRLGELYEALADNDLTLPSGTCPSVGIGGITLGGGFGSLGRRYGLTLDRLLAARVVLADGRLIECDAEHHADLFWALRGAGAGNFGVVTSFTFDPVPAPRMTAFQVAWSFVHAAAVIAAWQRSAPTGPDELAADLVLTAPDDPAAEPSVEVYGTLIGTEREASELLEVLSGRVGNSPLSTSCTERAYRETTRHLAALSVTNELVEEAPSGPISRQGYRLTKSEFFDRPLPDEAIAGLVARLTAERVAGQHRSLEFAAWGGAYNRRSHDATAFVHRDQLFSLEHSGLVDPKASPPSKRATRDWVTRSWASVHRWGSGRVYPNFPDPDLDDWGGAYYGENLAALLRVKAKYDPDGFFRFGQSLPVR